MVHEEVTMNVRGHEYQIPFPNVGQFYRIEALKQSLSKGFYNAMVMSSTVNAVHALDMIDIQATLVVLCPQMIEDLKVKNFDELGIADYKVIRDAYNSAVLPFFKEIQDLLSGKEDAEDVKK